MQKLFLICCYLIYTLTYAEINSTDAVHAKIATKVYFSSDLINLQKSIHIRLCELNGQNPNFLNLVKRYFKDKSVNLELTSSDLLDEKLAFKKNELDGIIIIVKLIQVLVDQQVSLPKSSNNPMSNSCMTKAKVAEDKKVKILTWYNKLVFLDDLLILKASIEKDENKKQLALQSILDSLDKQLKHEIMIKLE